MFRLGGQSDTKPPVLSSQASLVLIYRPNEERPGFDARCHQTPSEYTRSTCSLNQWVRSLVGLITSAGTGEYFPPLQSRCRNCGGGDRGRVAIYRPFGELRRAKIVLSPVWCSRPTTGVPLAHATMNFVGLDLTASDRFCKRYCTIRLAHLGNLKGNCDQDYGLSRLKFRYPTATKTQFQLPLTLRENR
ncbi:hypothetical protein TNCV_1311511 [Trichonephila clavipes]|nr:hypothetical protein TNCV_1311511 [Trichonephila clavipes]